MRPHDFELVTSALSQESGIVYFDIVPEVDERDLEDDITRFAVEAKTDDAHIVEASLGRAGLIGDRSTVSSSPDRPVLEWRNSSHRTSKTQTNIQIVTFEDLAATNRRNKKEEAENRK